MQEIAGILPLNREEKESSKPQLLLKRLNLNRNLKEDKLGQPPKSKNKIKNIISSQLFLAL
jgi:hypothetical protein